MKKILTLFVALLAITSVFAQRDESRRVILGDDRTVYGGNNHYPQQYPQTYPTTSREQRIYEINREYDARINSVRYDRRFSRRERERAIRSLELERRQRIAAINDYYSNRNRRYDNDRDDWKDNSHHGNNGNHYGWGRGKGNPHR